MVEVSYYSPVEPSLFGLCSLLLIGAGLLFMAFFFVYEMKAPQSGGRNVFLELIMATISSFLLGFGTLFLALWSGIWV